jgi:hypothetical protein
MDIYYLTGKSNGYNKGNNTSQNCGLIIVVVLFVLFFIIIICGACWCSTKGNEAFTNILPKQNSRNNYNALYTSPDHNVKGSYIYTQPPGDTKAQKYGSSGQGTSGEFFPIQGIGAGIYMKNSSLDNLALPSPNTGKIGGQDNYTSKDYSSSWIGFNNYGYPFASQKGPEVESNRYTNSYTISSANERVCNSGQKCDNLKCEDWWPALKKGSHGFCTQGSDAMVSCKFKNVDSCKGQGGNRFLKDKMGSRWRRVLDT